VAKTSFINFILKEAKFTKTNQICECGKYAFWRIPGRLKGYASEHWQKANAAKAKEQPQV
jgi:hypothetical protein